MRIKPRCLHHLLSEARCELCGVSWESLDKEERDCLTKISSSMDNSPNIRSNKKLAGKYLTSQELIKLKPSG